MRGRIAKTSLRFRLAAAFIGFTLLVSAGLLLVAGVSTRHYLREQLRQKLMAIAAEGALKVSPTLLAQVETRADESGAAYLTLKRRLQAFRDSRSGLRYVYTIKPSSSPAQWRFLVDAEEDPKLVSHVGDLYDASPFPEMLGAVAGPTADRSLARDKWGRWLSGYAPITDRHGRTLAILGVDVSAMDVLREEHAVLRAVMIGLALCLVVSVFMADRFARALSRPIADLAEATHRIAEGELSAEVAVGGARELATLEQSFNLMSRSLRKHHERLVELSNTDFLTGLHNHRYFQDRLGQEVARARRYDRPLALVMFDLDLFHEVNALHGHQGGDDVLRQVAAVIRGTLRECDSPTRYGGEEFALIMPETTRDEAREAAERLREVVEEYPFRIRSLTRQADLRLTISGGVASFPDDSTDKDGLVVAADLALLRAKHTTRNSVCVYSEEDKWHPARVDPAHLHRALRDASIAAAQSLAVALDARDHYNRGHSENVTRLAIAAARSMGVPTETATKLRIAGLLHDIGKIGIPDQVLNKRAELDPEESKLIRAHPSLGASILARAPLLSDIIPVVLGHHERYDGGGYPQGIAGEDIPLGARILAVADAYDAMTSDRPYRPAMSREQALAELRAQAGRQFDPQVVAVFEEISEDLDREDLLSLGAEDAV